MPMKLENRCANLLSELNLGSPSEIKAITPLTGGVSSDIALVDIGSRKICVKFALEQLKVAQEWYANVERNRAEYCWMEFVSSLLPEATPALLGCSKQANGFAMEFIQGEDVFLWKKALLEGKKDTGEAKKVGHTLGRIHQASSTANIAHLFQNQEDFYALRLEPYLLFTSLRHPEISDQLQAIITSLSSINFVLIHGDVSPKNIMFKNQMPIFLDAECATMGDPCFDVSFCLNHLVIKAIHLKNQQQDLLNAVRNFYGEYRCYVSWEALDDLEKRVCQLLPALMLARVDGKSPVEYLDETEKKKVRELAIPLIQNPEIFIETLITRIKQYLEMNL